MARRGLILQSLPFQGFQGGLNLRDKSDSVSPAEAVDAINVFFTDVGAIQSRPGYNNYTTAELTNRAESLEAYYTAAGTKQLVAGCGTRLETIKEGSVVASATGLSGGPWDFTRFGKPNEEAVYAGNGTDSLRKWDGSNWTNPTITVNGEGAKTGLRAASTCVFPAGNRLVCGAFGTTTGGPGGAESSPSHVYFSEAGNPESFESTAFIQFTPGDGEKVQAVVAWREFVFVFKESKFFVVTDTAVDSEGKPEFVFQPVETGVGLASPRAIAIHPSGVYFMSRHGVYRTTGQEPEEVSQIIEPIWSGDTSPFYTGGSLAFSGIKNCAMGAWEDRIYLAYPTSEANSRILVYDPQYQWWSLYNIPASCFTTFRVEDDTELVFGYASGEKMVGRHKLDYTTDDGAAIKSRWRQGWVDLGNADIKWLRATKIWGSGEVSIGVDRDFSINTGKTEELNLTGSTGSVVGGPGVVGGEGFVGDAAGALVGKERRIAQRGTVLSTLFTSEVPFSIHRLEYLVPSVEEAAKISA